MSIKKSYLKKKPVCKVTFKVSKEMANGASEVYLVGEFNEWNTTADPMDVMKSGAFKKTLSLESGKEYQFRYLIGKDQWENEPEADKAVPSAFSDAENSVVIT